MKGTAMGSSISPIVFNLFMEIFEVIVMNTSHTPTKYLEDACG